jgi:predicted metal-dependent hydrolase
VTVVRHRRARRYLLRVTDAGTVRLTVPPRGSRDAGLRFAVEQAHWIAAEWARRVAASEWADGTVMWYRGERHALRVATSTVTWADCAVGLAAGAANLRAAVQAYLRSRASRELVVRCRELADRTGLRPSRIAVRNQQSRWGSCSARGAVMLNWRLIQMPPLVADYVILHELVHLVHPNHSRRFWRAVATVCADWQTAERWLRAHGRDLL